MYWHVRAALRSSQSKLATRLVLVVLCDHANNEGVCWLGGGTLAWEANVSTRQVWNAVKELARFGEIEVESRRGLKGVNRYTVLLHATEQTAQTRVESRGETRTEPETTRTEPEQTRNQGEPEGEFVQNVHYPYAECAVGCEQIAVGTEQTAYKAPRIPIETSEAPQAKEEVVQPEGGGEAATLTPSGLRGFAAFGEGDGSPSCEVPGEGPPEHTAAALASRIEAAFGRPLTDAELGMFRAVHDATGDPALVARCLLNNALCYLDIYPEMRGDMASLMWALDFHIKCERGAREEAVNVV